VTHQEYSGEQEDTFSDTSLHLSFTDWKVPLGWEHTGDIDQEAFLLETLVSVRDGETWVGDIDVLGIERNRPEIISFPCKCEETGGPTMINAVSIRTWDQFLDQPRRTAVLQTKENGMARLAAVPMLLQQGYSSSTIVVKDGRACWKCVGEQDLDPPLTHYRIIL
jgi:hypothetical protein